MQTKLITLGLAALMPMLACEQVGLPPEPPPVKVPDASNRPRERGNEIPIKQPCNAVDRSKAPSHFGSGTTLARVILANIHQSGISIRWEADEIYSDCEISEGSGYILEQRKRLLTEPAFADEDVGWENISNSISVSSNLRSGEYKLPRLDWYSEYQYRLRFFVSGAMESENTEKLIFKTPTPPSPILIEAKWDSADSDDIGVRWTERPSVYNDSNVSYHLRWREKPSGTEFANDAWEDRLFGPPFSSGSGSLDYKAGLTSERIYFLTQVGTTGTDYEWQIRSCVGIDTTSNSDIPESNPSCSKFISVRLQSDNDGDGKLNHADACPNGETDWRSDANTDKDGDGCRDAGEDVDDDNNGLMEIASLDAFLNIQYNLEGTSYDTDANDTDFTFATCGTNSNKGSICGAPTTPPSTCAGRTTGTNLCGYELVGDLDFAVEGSYATGEVNTAWRPTSDDGDIVEPASAPNAGFPGIDATGPPDSRTCFSGIFAGNSHAIRNLYMRSDSGGGLFRCVDATGIIRGVGLVDANVYATSGMVGSLVGSNRGTIVASYSTGNVNVTGGNGGSIGGLVGYNGGSIVASYATGDVNGGGGDDSAGGLVGKNEAKIIASYATGDVNAGDGNDSAGGLVGSVTILSDSNPSIRTSYATGTVNGGGDDDSVGGLVGTIHGDAESASDIAHIVASYTTSAVYGDSGNDKGKLLVGAYEGTASSSNLTITKSYAFGSLDDSSVEDGSGGSDGDSKPTGATGASDLSPTNAGDSWNNEGQQTSGAWQFGNDANPRHAPRLLYAEYDGIGSGSTRNYCDASSSDMVFPSAIRCGVTVLAGQEAASTYAYTCDNGNPVTATRTTDEGALENCRSCTSPGYEKMEQIGSTGRRRCKLTYTCDNGNRNLDDLTGSTIPLEDCARCDPGYTPTDIFEDGSDTLRDSCELTHLPPTTTYSYVCTNGESGDVASGTTTDADATENCATCTKTGYTKIEDIPGSGNPPRKTCKPIYTCANGDANTATITGTTTLEDCTDCDTGYEETDIMTTPLGRHSCKPIYTCANGDANTATITGTTTLEDCTDCDTGYEETDIMTTPLGRHSCKPIYTCANGDANTATITGTTTLEDCTDCDTGYEETDILIAPLGRHSCKPIYTCANGDANTATITGTTTLEDCTDCDTGYEETDIMTTPLGRHSCKPVYTCANGVAKSGTPMGGVPIVDCASCPRSDYPVRIEILDAAGDGTGRYECQTRIISAGADHSCATHDDGALKCWGKNDNGQLGDNTSGVTANKDEPTEVIASGVRAVSAGGSHTCAIQNGALKCWGNNLYGQLGDNTSGATAKKDEPTQVIASGVRAVSAGYAHTCAIMDSDGELKCWGRNNYGQLGDNTSGATANKDEPTQVIASGVKSVSTGAYHTCAIMDSDGELKCWGRNSYGQLGDDSNGETAHKDEPTQVIASGVRSVSAGDAHTCAIMDSSGELKCWGRNNDRQLGLGSSITADKDEPTQVIASGVRAVSADGSHTCAIIDSSGELKCWGLNDNGQLGDGTSGSAANKDEPTQAIASGVRVVSAGGSHTCAIIDSSGELKCWGRNNYGQLGDKTTTGSLFPTPVAIYDYICTNGVLTSGSTADSSDRESCATCDSNYEKTITGYDRYSCELITNDAYACVNGEAADGTATDAAARENCKINACDAGYTRVAIGSTGRHTCQLLAVSAGNDNHTCAIIGSSSALQCWGNNGNGRLGDGSTTERTSPVEVIKSGVRAVSTGYGHTCAIIGSSGGLKCWGLNNYGQVGDNSTMEKHTPTQVIGLKSGVRAVSTGFTHTCAIMDSGGTTGILKCWGRNNNDQLGLGNAAGDKHIPTEVIASGVTAVSAGSAHTCAIHNGGLKCWGNNGNGRLGDDSTVRRSSPKQVIASGVQSVSAGNLHTCAIMDTSETTTGVLKCWGKNNRGQLGDNSTTEKHTPTGLQNASNTATLNNGVQSVSAGGFHTCAIDSSGALKCWGNNGNGRLGDNSMTRRLTPTGLQNASNTATLNNGVQSVSAGNEHTCAIDGLGVLKCWGNNTNGRLGDGSITRRTSPVAILTPHAYTCTNGVPVRGFTTNSAAPENCAYCDSGTMTRIGATNRYSCTYQAL